MVVAGFAERVACGAIYTSCNLFESILMKIKSKIVKAH